MGLILKYKKEILLAILIILGYFVSRLILLGNFPIFTDEAIYVRWAQIASNDANWRFISLTDGKQPMLIWVGMVLVKFISDPLVAVRLVSVAAGFFSLVGLWLLSFELFKSKKVAFLSSILYIFYPFAVVYDRMALYDSLVGAFALWALYFSILLVRRLKSNVAYPLGFILGGGLLTKSSAIFSIYLLPFTLLLFDFKKKNWKVNLIKWAAFATLAAIISEGFYNFLRLSPFFHIIAEKNSIFVYPISEWIKHPFTFFFGNLRGLGTWLFVYLTPFYVILIGVSLLSRKFIREKALLVIYFLLPFLALALFGRVIFPRFILFMSLYLLPLGAFGLNQIIDYADEFMSKRKINSYFVVAGLVTLFFLLYPAKVGMDFIFNPSDANIASADKQQYITQWPAGGGVKESIEYFKQQSKNQKIFIGTEGTFGLMPAALDIYLVENKNIITKGYWPITDQIPAETLTNSQQMPTYFIFYQPCLSCKFIGDAPPTWPLKLVLRIKKSDNVYYSVYKVQ